MIPLKIKEYIDQKTILSSTPTLLNIEVTSICNLKCPICPNWLTESKGIISLEFLDKLISKNRSLLERQTVWLHFSGEPLLHPRLPEIIEMLKSNNIKTRLSTNATLLTHDKAYEIMSAGLDYIVFSFDGNSPESYEKIRVGADFSQVMSNILTFLEIKKYNNFETKTQIQFIRTNFNNREIKKFVKRWLTTDIDCINIKSLSSRAGRVDLSYFLPNKNSSRKINNKPCYYLWDTLIVLWNGMVIPCCQDLLGEGIVGDANINTLEEIWNSPELQRLRKEQLDHKFSGVCSRCCDKKDCSHNYISYLVGRFLNNFLEKITGKMFKDEGMEIQFNKKKY